MEIKFNEFAEIGRKFNINWKKRSMFNSRNKQTNSGENLPRHGMNSPSLESLSWDWMCCSGSAGFPQQ